MKYLEIFEMRGDDFFNMESAPQIYNDRSRETLIYMSPQDFLKMARYGYDQEKMDTIKSVQGKFRNIPMLGFVHDNKGNGQVIQHEGRHRARLMLEKGVTEMPVLFLSIEGPGRGIRWGQQKEEKYVMPKTLKSEDGSITIPFPKSAIYPDG
jgi:hypothetical protein